MVKVKCPVCGKEFTKAGLSGHIRFKHGKQITTRQGKPSIPREEGRVTLLTKEQAKPIMLPFEEAKPMVKAMLTDLFKEVWEMELFKQGVRQMVREVLEPELIKLGFKKKDA